MQQDVTESYNQNARRKVCNRREAWLFANERGIQHHVCHMVSLSHVFTPVNTV